MGEILSQSEINSLLNRLPKSDQIASNIGHAAQSAADQPDRVNSELAPAVARRIESLWSQLLQNTVRVAVKPAVPIASSMIPSGQTGITIRWYPDDLDLLIQTFSGGQGVGRPVQRENLTEWDHQLIGWIEQLTKTHLKSASGMTSDFLARSENHQEGVWLEFEMECLCSQGPIRFVLTGNSAQLEYWLESDSSPEKLSASERNAVAITPKVQFRAILARMNLSPAEFQQLEVGDILLSEHGLTEPIHVLVQQAGHCEELQGSPGIEQGHKAVRIRSSNAVTEPTPTGSSET